MDTIVPHFRCYWYEEFPSNLENLLRDSEKYAFHGIIIPMSNPLFTREFHNETIAKNHQWFTRSGCLTTNVMWKENILPKLSDSVDCDSSDEIIRYQSKKTLEQELKYILHHRTDGLVLVRLKSGNVKNLARIVSKTAKCILVEVPLVDPIVHKQKWICDGGGDTAIPCGTDTWQWWDNFREACYPDVALCVCLDINAYQEEFPTWSALRRWLGEPVRMVTLPSYIFELNHVNNYSLAGKYKFLFELFKYSCGKVSLKVNYKNDEDIVKYPNAAKFLQIKWRIDNIWNSVMTHYAEVPQPITLPTSNLSYTQMEKDPVKYKLYQQAFENALLTRPQHSRQTVLIVGAGRGAMVRAILNSAQRTQRHLKLYLVEINENAVFFLRILKEDMWKSGSDMEIVLSDIRDYTPPEPLDFIISELFGEFSDNNLYPELIYPLCKYLKPDGISIPCKITSYLNPIMSHIAHGQVKKLGFSLYLGVTYEIYNIDEPQPVFEYNFPNTKQTSDYEKYKRLVFTSEQDCNLHGFNGYFDCCLFDDVVLSIVPGRFTNGLKSWSAIYFPIVIPQTIKALENIEVEFWRCVNNQNMWYEWRVSRPLKTDVQNPLGEWWTADKR